jgi:hypothetical protein
MTRQQWEYKLVYLNINSRPQPQSLADDRPPAGPPGQPAEALFSKEFLEQQFPEYYSEDKPKPKPQEPPKSGGIQQLADFFNHMGADGWEYISREEIANVTLLIFRRPKE